MKGLSIDKDGFYRADFPGIESIIGWFLEQDIQPSPEVCRYYIAELEAVLSGKAKTWSGTGNAFTVTADGPDTTIRCEFNDAYLKTSTRRVLECLKAWLEHINPSA